MDKEIEARKKLATRAAKEAGKILLNNFGRISYIKTKADKSFVTNVDIKVENHIVSLIKNRFPEDNILAEEDKYQYTDSEYKWVIDPLDGTHNYIRGIEFFGTSIALAYRDRVVAGVIYMPVGDELFVAVKNKGSFLNRKKVFVSKRNLGQSTIIYDSDIKIDTDIKVRVLGELVSRVFNVRMFGSSARNLSFITCGKIDLVIEYNDKPWDFAAGLLLIEEAGGKVTDLEGKIWDLNTMGYVASNGIIHGEVLKIIKKIVSR